jgi:septum formation inhibitor MinC
MAVAEEKPVSRSSHVSDPALAPFLQSNFDPAEYLNATLPALSLSSASARPLKSAHAVPLADLSSQTQDLLSQLNAHTTRLSTILTQLTDDILRSGARLAYEVEVLRGETIGLTETLTDGLKEDVGKFVPGGIKIATEPKEDEIRSPALAAIADEGAEEQARQAQAQEITGDTTPEYISDLRTLTTVRSRLETVIKVFGEAMHWTLPPSEISITSSLISVSAPDPSSDAGSQEQKGKEFAASLRSEIADLITGDPENGREKAETRIQALKDLAMVWKGTAEEKARGKFVEGLVKVAEERQREVERERERNRQRPGKSGSVKAPQTPAVQQQKSGGGFLENLQRIRGFVE